MYLHIDSTDPEIARASRKAALTYANYLPNREEAHELIRLVQTWNGRDQERIDADILSSDKFYFDLMLHESESPVTPA